MAALLVILQAVLLWVVVVLLRRRSVAPLLSTAILFYSIMWYVAPSVIGTLGNRGLFASSLVDEVRFTQQAALETVLLILALLPLLRSKPYFQGAQRTSLGRTDVTTTAALLILIVGLSLTLMQSRVLSTYSSSSYLDRNAFAVASEGNTEYNVLGSVAFVQDLLVAFGYLAVIYRPWKGARGVAVFVVAIVWIGLFAAQSLISGGRIMLFVPLMLLVMYARLQNWSLRKSFVSVAFAALIMLPIASILLITIQEARGGEQLTLRDVSQGATDVASSLDTQDIGLQFFDQIVTKFDSFSSGAFLVEAGGSAKAGIRPYEGALASLVPRAILPDKPVPGSIDSTYRGHPSRLVPTLAGMTDESANVGVSAGAIATWQFGPAGLALVVVANILNLYIINSLLLASSPISKSLGIYLLGLPTLVTLFASPDVILMNIERLVVVYSVLTLVIGLTRRRRILVADWQKGASRRAQRKARTDTGSV